MLTQLLWIHLASLFLHTVASLATATSLAAAGRVLLSPPLGKAVPPAPQYRRHHPDLSRLEPVTCLDSLMASDICQHPLHTHPAHCPTRFDSSPDPGPRLRGDVGTGSGGAGSPPTFTNQQLGELILCAPRFEGAECCILPTGGGSRTWRRLEQRVNAAAAFRQRQLQRLQEDMLPPQRPLSGQLPHCADKRQGRRSSCVAPALICRWRQIGWHRSRRHARLAGGSWGRGPVPTCAAASRPSHRAGGFLGGRRCRLSLQEGRTRL